MYIEKLLRYDTHWLKCYSIMTLFDTYTFCKHYPVMLNAIVKCYRFMIQSEMLPCYKYTSENILVENSIRL